MSIINKIKKLITAIAFLKPKTMFYGMAPQTVKIKGVEVKKVDGEDNIYVDGVGARYAAITIKARRPVTFKDGQTFKPGENAFFKYEKVLWDIGGHVFEEVSQYKWEKNGERYCISKAVLAPDGMSMKYFLKQDEIANANPITVNNFREGYSMEDGYALYPNWETHIRKGKRKVTDFALALGVTAKNGRPYHTKNRSGYGVAPNGKIKKQRKNVVYGEVLQFTALETEVFNRQL